MKLSCNVNGYSGGTIFNTYPIDRVERFVRVDIASSLVLGAVVVELLARVDEVEEDADGCGV